MGKAVNLMMSGKSGGAKNTENGPTSTGPTLQEVIAKKDAGIKSGSVTDAGLTRGKLAGGEKTNALF